MNVPPRYTGTIWLTTVVIAALLAVSGRIGSDGQSRFGPTEVLSESGSLPVLVQLDACQSLSPGYQ